MPRKTPTRRQWLKTTGVVAASALLAGCNAGQGSESTTTSRTTTAMQTTTDPEIDQQEVDVSDPEAQQEETPDGWANRWSEYLDVRILESLDSSGDAAWDQSAHPRVYVSSNGPGYSGRPTNVENVGLAIIDAESHEVVATRQYDLGFTPFENHGSAVSYDGEYIYIPTANSESDDPDTIGRLLIIDAETLNIDTVLQTASAPHHIKTFERADGKPVTLAYTFNQNIPSYNAISPGSGVWLMDPDDDHRVIGGMRSEDFQTEPYLAFPHPDGRHLFVGTDSRGKRVGHGQSYWAVADMQNWEVVDWYEGGGNAIWTTFSSDGRYAYSSDGHHDFIFKVDCETGEVVNKSSSATHGVYGIQLNQSEDKLYAIGKGEGSHNLGKSLGLVNPGSMTAVNQWSYECVRGDHGLLNPFNPSELWVSCNANQVDVVWDTENDELKESIESSGSSHNGAFVDYETSDDWKVQFDQAGWHGYSLDDHLDELGVDEVMTYGTQA